MIELFKDLEVNPYVEKVFGITEATKQLKALKYKEPNIKSILDSLTFKSSPKILVEESDPRPAVVSSKGMLESIES